jgi:heme A synthase
MVISRFAKYAWAVLFYNLAVILWGAFVRATGSGRMRRPLAFVQR